VFLEFPANKDQLEKETQGHQSPEPGGLSSPGKSFFPSELVLMWALILGINDPLTSGPGPGQSSCTQPLPVAGVRGGSGKGRVSGNETKPNVAQSFCVVLCDC
jgi:hypothetical protein